MNHSDLQTQIPEYVAARLDAQRRDDLEEHLATCEECLALVDACEEIAHGMREPARAAHPDPLVLKAYVDDANDPAVADVERHLAICPSCSLEVTAWTRWHPPVAVTTTEPRTSGFGSWLAWRPLAAGALLGAALVMIALGPFGTGWQGQADLLLLEDPTRNGATIKSVGVAPGQPGIPLYVSFVLPSDASGERRFRFATADADGVAVWEDELTADKIRAELTRAYAVGFLIPTATHPPGRYVLRVSTEDASPILEIPFDVRP